MTQNITIRLQNCLNAPVKNTQKQNSYEKEMSQVSEKIPTFLMTCKTWKYNYISYNWESAWWCICDQQLVKKTNHGTMTVKKTFNLETKKVGGRKIREK